MSPASFPTAEWVQRSAQQVASWGFRARIGDHVLDRIGFLAGSDEDRLADVNGAIRDPHVRGIVTLLGGCGSQRLVQSVDVKALRADPKPLVGYSDITALHRVWHHAGVVSLHGPMAGDNAEDVRGFLTGGVAEPLRMRKRQWGAELTTTGLVSGPLFGGNLEMLARTVGVLEFDLTDHILLLEVIKAAGLGNVDRALTQLLLSGSLDGVIGVAIGFLHGFEGYVDRGWTILDVLSDRLGPIDVPVLAGLPLGHDANPRTVALGIDYELNADLGTLTALTSASTDHSHGRA